MESTASPNEAAGNRPWPLHPNEIASFEAHLLRNERLGKGLCPECERPFTREALTPRRVVRWNLSGADLVAECGHVCGEAGNPQCPHCGQFPGAPCTEFGDDDFRDCAGRPQVQLP